MSDTNDNHDLFSASLESIETSKRVEKFQRFKKDFHRDCTATLDNAQEWIKAELPIITDYIDTTSIKDEIKQTKTSSRRKHLLSALLFEKSTRESILQNNAPAAAIMAMHMFNHMWQAKVELHGVLPRVAASSSIAPVKQPAPDETYNDTREKILTSLIEKGEKLQNDSLIQAKVEAESKTKKTTKKAKSSTKKTIFSKSTASTKKKTDTWAEEFEKDKKRKLFELASKKTNGKAKKKTDGMLSKVKTKLPLNRRKKSIISKFSNKPATPTNEYLDNDLFDDPNRSAIMVRPGFSDSIDDSLIQERRDFPRDPNASGVTVHKMLKAREHEKQEPGSNTIIMKLASGANRKLGTKMSVPEQCQAAINQLTQQFPGYDLIAIRHMAAEKVGVSPQYIENLNILPEKTA